MDQFPSTSTSRLPRPSRLPVPRAIGVRPVPSKENLQAPVERLTIAKPRLRSAPSRDQLYSSTSSKARISSTSSRSQDPASVPSRNPDSFAQAVSHTSQTQTPRRKASQSRLFRKQSASLLRREPLEPLDVREDEDCLEEGGGEASREQGFSKISRKSLSERAMETLQSIPSSPAMQKRTSSFYNLESPMRSASYSSRPGSSNQNDIPMGPPRIVSSRPTSSAETDQSLPPDSQASTSKLQAQELQLRTRTTPKYPVDVMALETSSTSPSIVPPLSTSSLRLPSPSALRQASPSPIRTSSNIPSIKSESKTLSAQPLKPRTSINGLFRKPSMPTIDQSAELDRIGFVGKKKSTTFSNTSSEGTASSRASKSTTVTSISTDELNVTPRKSSLALRDQIAQAKAAKRAAATTQISNIAAPETDEDASLMPSGTFDFGLSDDPFNLKANQKGAKGLLRKRIDSARSDGRLNIAAMELQEIPEDVMNMYNLESMDGSWAEAVDLTNFVAADNEFELIGDNVFPDIDPRELVDDDDAKGNQFGGLETLDLHGNVLVALPLGLRRLGLLTTLNLVSL